TDHLFETVGQSARGAIGHEAELSDGAHHSVAGLRARCALAVQDARYGGDGDAGQLGDVVDGQGSLGSLRLCHRAWPIPLALISCRVYALTGKRLPDPITGV